MPTIFQIIYEWINTTKIKNIFRSTQQKYLAGIALDLLLILIIMLFAYKPTMQLISPLVRSAGFLSFVTPQKNTINNLKSFSFAPGWTRGKLDMIDFTNLDTLAFFDIPANSDGTLNTDNDGYAMFESDNASQLFATAHSHHTKVLLTITLVDAALIEKILDDQSFQQTLMNESQKEAEKVSIDGILLDVEYNGTQGLAYGPKFSRFAQQFSTFLRQKSPNLSFNIALENNATQKKIYDVKTLSQSSNKIYVMAYDFAAPELHGNLLTSPLYGADSKNYWNTVNHAISEFESLIPKDKLVMERAWIGDGQNYPFYSSDNNIDRTVYHNTLSTPLSSQVVNELVSKVPQNAQDAAKESIPYIAKALEREGILNAYVLAYTMATIEHETAGTFEPIEEFKGRKNARRFGYEGGTDYFGRGYIQLTHLRNYKKIGERIGIGDELVKNPDLALRPDIAASILAAFFKDNHIAALAISGDFIDARMPVNPDGMGYWVATLAYKYLAMI